jgi:hypothetical protein
MRIDNKIHDHFIVIKLLKFLVELEYRFKLFKSFI